MSVLETIKRRQSIRAYESREVEEEKLLAILEAGRLAPSAVNFQPWTFVVIRKDRARLKTVYDRKWFLSAPVVIAVCIDRGRAWKRADGRSYADVDAAIAMDHMILAATELGLGTCWVGAFNKEDACRALDLPENIEPMLFTPLGYPAQQPTRQPREPLDKIVRWEHY
jgi:nitroreductase